jgi:hypothetical protein
MRQDAVPMHPPPKIRVKEVYDLKLAKIYKLFLVSTLSSSKGFFFTSHKSYEEKSVYNHLLSTPSMDVFEDISQYVYFKQVSNKHTDMKKRALYSS